MHRLLGFSGAVHTYKTDSEVLTMPTIPTYPLIQFAIPAIALNLERTPGYVPLRRVGQEEVPPPPPVPLAPAYHVLIAEASSKDTVQFGNQKGFRGA